MEADRLERADVARDVHRVLADEEVEVGLETVHRVAGGSADETLVGLDARNGRVESRARHRVPGGEEGRVEWEPQADQLDGRDLQAQSPR